jgi:hypothetical protein
MEVRNEHKINTTTNQSKPKEVEDGHKPPVLRAAILETTVRLFQGWPAGGRKVGHGRPLQYFRESMGTACHKPMKQGILTAYSQKNFCWLLVL